MGKIYTFSQRVQGYSHIEKNVVCQDYTDTYQNEHYSIAVVSDGHGDSSCFRSDFGSQKAVEVSLETIKSLAEQIVNQEADNNFDTYNRLKDKKQSVELIKKLTDKIIKSWKKEIKAHLDDPQNVITEEQYEKCGSYGELYRNGKRLSHIYGATLIIAFKIKDLLILIHQGDGSCLVFFEDGKVEKPVPADEKCFANITTSLCDANAKDNIRHAVVDLSKRKVIACFVASDGVEDSYTDDEGHNNFYKELMVEYFYTFNKSHDKLIDYLKDYLPKFSKNGSADDVSVSGIVNIAKMEIAVAKYQEEIDKYDNLHQYNFYNDKVNSMKRKHEFLKEKFEKAYAEYDPIRRKYEENEAIIKDLQNKINSVISASNKNPKSDEEFNKLIEIRNKTDADSKEIQAKIENKKIDLNKAEALKAEFMNKIQSY